MAESAAEQQPSGISETGEAKPTPPRSSRVEPDLLEAKIVERLERVVRAAGARLRRLRTRIKERREHAATTGAAANAEGQRPGGESAFHVPEEVRGIVERYPVQAMLASCGAGYLLGALVSARRK